MVTALDAQSGETIVEIGAGLGVVTTQLVETYGTRNIHIKAVEVDPRFIDKLKNMFKHQDNLEVIETNILDLLPEFSEKAKIIGSLPYYITSPILHKILAMPERPQTCVLLVQKEVAEKILSTAPDSVYLSVLMQTFFEVESLGVVDRSEFSPTPEVDGSIIKLTRRESTTDINARRYEGFLKKVFANPRKMLNKTFKEDELNRAQLDGNMRPQNYDWEKWSKAFRILV